MLGSWATVAAGTFEGEIVTHVEFLYNERAKGLVDGTEVWEIEDIEDIEVILVDGLDWSTSLVDQHYPLEDFQYQLHGPAGEHGAEWQERVRVDVAWHFEKDCVRTEL